MLAPRIQSPDYLSDLLPLLLEPLLRLLETLLLPHFRLLQLVYASWNRVLWLSFCAFYGPLLHLIFFYPFYLQCEGRNLWICDFYFLLRLRLRHLCPPRPLLHPPPPPLASLSLNFEGRNLWHSICAFSLSLPLPLHLLPLRPHCLKYVSASSWN